MKWWLKQFFCRHRWDTHQVAVDGSYVGTMTFVIAWKQCAKCAASRLIHILV